MIKRSVQNTKPILMIEIMARGNGPGHIGYISFITAVEVCYCHQDVSGSKPGSGQKYY